jgi:hypothetical protein
MLDAGTQDAALELAPQHVSSFGGAKPWARDQGPIDPGRPQVRERGPVRLADGGVAAR